ncbi:MAG: methyltransferase domain-containing protein [Alphaproteobacteria bacterium]|nr:methyltransferase domain-containing protein [Alphaproteobacteria bacterium]
MLIRSRLDELTEQARAALHHHVSGAARSAPELLSGEREEIIEFVLRHFDVLVIGEVCDDKGHKASEALRTLNECYALMWYMGEQRLIRARCEVMARVVAAAPKEWGVQSEVIQAWEKEWAGIQEPIRDLLEALRLHRAPPGGPGPGATPGAPASSPDAGSTSAFLDNWRFGMEREIYLGALDGWRSPDGEHLFQDPQLLAARRHGFYFLVRRHHLKGSEFNGHVHDYRLIYVPRLKFRVPLAPRGGDLRRLMRAAAADELLSGKRRLFELDIGHDPGELWGGAEVSDVETSNTVPALRISFKNDRTGGTPPVVLDGLLPVVEPQCAAEIRGLIHFFQELVEVLRQAHKRDIVHGALRIEDVLVRRGAEGLRLVKILDWGRVAGGDRLWAQSDSLACGRDCLCPPTNGDAGQRTLISLADVLALALIMLQVLAGQERLERMRRQAGSTFTDALMSWAAESSQDPRGAPTPAQRLRALISRYLLHRPSEPTALWREPRHRYSLHLLSTFYEELTQLRQECDDRSGPTLLGPMEVFRDALGNPSRFSQVWRGVCAEYVRVDEDALAEDVQGCLRDMERGRGAQALAGLLRLSREDHRPEALPEDAQVELMIARTILLMREVRYQEAEDWLARTPFKNTARLRAWERVLRLRVARSLGKPVEAPSQWEVLEQEDARLTAYRENLALLVLLDSGQLKGHDEQLSLARAFRAHHYERIFVCLTFARAASRVSASASMGRRQAAWERAWQLLQNSLSTCQYFMLPHELAATLQVAAELVHAELGRSAQARMSHDRIIPPGFTRDVASVAGAGFAEMQAQVSRWLRVESSYHKGLDRWVRLLSESQRPPDLVRVIQVQGFRRTFARPARPLPSDRPEYSISRLCDNWRRALPSGPGFGVGDDPGSYHCELFFDWLGLDMEAVFGDLGGLSIPLHAASPRALDPQGRLAEVIGPLMCHLPTEDYGSPEARTSEGRDALHRLLFTRIAEERAVSRPLRILVVGSGFGVEVGKLAAAGHEVVGVDRSPSRVVQGEERLAKAADLLGGRARLKILDLHHLGDVPDMQERFDVVVARDVLGHLSRKLRALRALHGALKPEGTLVLSDLVHCTPKGSSLDVDPESWMQLARQLRLTHLWGLETLEDRLRVSPFELSGPPVQAGAAAADFFHACGERLERSKAWVTGRSGPELAFGGQLLTRLEERCRAGLLSWVALTATKLEARPVEPLNLRTGRPAPRPRG